MRGRLGYGRPPKQDSGLPAPRPDDLPAALLLVYATAFPTRDRRPAAETAPPAHHAERLDSPFPGALCHETEHR